MKVALLAAAASLVLAFAAHAADYKALGPMARNPTASACEGWNGGLQRMRFSGTADLVSDTSLCPQFLSTLLMKLPRRDQRT